VIKFIATSFYCKLKHDVIMSDRLSPFGTTLRSRGKTTKFVASMTQQQRNIVAAVVTWGKTNTT